MGLLAFGSGPEFDDECVGFDDFWASLPPEWKSGRLGAHREWNKRGLHRPGQASKRAECKRAARLQSQTEKWRTGYRVNMDKWIRDGHEEDYVPEVRQVFIETCTHTPQCHNNQWHQVVLMREDEKARQA